MLSVQPCAAQVLAAIWVALTVMPVHAVCAAPIEIVTEEFMIDGADPGTRLYLRNKHPADLRPFSAERTALFVHGATQPAEATFDLPLDGLSWMDFIARSGWDVYLVDVRGYGRSTRPLEMDRPPQENPPLVRTDVAVRDLAAAVDFILRHRDVPRLSLMGWSWGTTLVGGYAAEHPAKVERLVLYAALWLSAPDQGVSAPSGAYVAAPMEVARQRLQLGAPEGELDALLPPAWYEAWSEAALASDPVGAAQDPPVLRSPAGARQDMRDHWAAGKPTYEPGRITAPTLLVTGAWDQLTPPDQAESVFNELASPIKRFVQIGAATHLMMLERNRLQLFHEVQLFLEDGLPARP